MKIHFHFKKFLIATILIFPILLLLDAVYDILIQEWDTSTLFSTENIIFKAIAAVIGGYFYAVLAQYKHRER
ncbi:hypothetical protein [Hydrotalea sp.]|uniref:hypothetical protein n=1 Tax=Hydrotalea sp. TaxID=2881279 RepID=UPI002618DB30|nr:hypothetical protein [Hydrotalea sp.]